MSLFSRTILRSLAFLSIGTVYGRDHGGPKDYHLTYDWQHSLYAPYIDAEGRNNNWDFDALVSMHEFVQLTPDQPSKYGWAFAKEIFEADEWSIDFFTRIYGNGQHLADGMAFWFSEDRFIPGNAYGYKENFKGLGVFFDIFQNSASHHQFPWISAMVGDGQKTYRHEDDGHEHQLGGCHRQIVNTHGPVQTRVTYYKKTLEVQIKIEEEEWHSCFVIPKVDLPSKGYIGFSAHTGALSARHDLLAVTTAKIDGPFDGLHSAGKKSLFFGNNHGNSETSHTKSFLLLLLILGLAGYGYFMYKNNEKRHHF